MTTLATQELFSDELEYGMLIDLIQEFQSGSVRKPDHFNNFHFLILLFYDAYGFPRDRYPLWRWYYRIKKKLFTSKHLIIDSEISRENIRTAIEDLIETNPTILDLVEEGVSLDEHYLHSSIHGLFKMYTPLHTYFYLEQIDQPIINKCPKIFAFIQQTIRNIYRKNHCDLIHFAISHKKTSLLEKIFDEKINWLDISMDLTTERGWLPIHYACYVGDKETVKTICDSLVSPTLSIHFDTISFLIPNFKQEQFRKHPNEYILKTSGVERDTPSQQQQQTRRQSSGSQMNVIDTTNQNHHRLNFDARDRPALSSNSLHNSNINISNDYDIPDADELELSSLPLIQRDEFIEKILLMYDTKQMLIPSPLILACMATCGDRTDYEDIVKILLDSHLVEFDGLNHECVLNYVLDYMHRKDYALFQHVQVYRDTEIEGPSAFVFYQFDGFIVNQEVRPLSGAFSGSSATLNTSKNDESAASDDGHSSEAPVSVRCFLTVLVLRDTFLQYPRWDFHLLRENIEEHFVQLEGALGCRPTILYPDGDVISSHKRSDVTWEVIVKYRLSSETGQSLYMQVDYFFFETFGDPLADAFASVYQSPFYISCMTDSTVMMDLIFDSFFKRRNLHCWGTIAQKHLEHCFDGVLQTKNNCSSFLSLCATLSRYYQVDGDPFMEENSAIIQRIFVHGFACCVRRNAKIELDYLIRNHALIYYDSCRTKPSDIRHNILTYCVVRNLAIIFDQLMTNMKTTMYKTYQNSTNPDWQPHIAWREIIHVIIDPALQNGANEQGDFCQLAAYGDVNTSFVSGGSISTLHTTGAEYIRCKRSREKAIQRIYKRLPPQPNTSLNQNAINQTNSDGNNSVNQVNYVRSNSNSSATGITSSSATKRSKNIFKHVNRLRWGAKHGRHNSTGTTRIDKPAHSLTVGSGQDNGSVGGDAISLVSLIFIYLFDQS